MVCEHRGLAVLRSGQMEEDLFRIISYRNFKTRVGTVNASCTLTEPPT